MILLPLAIVLLVMMLLSEIKAESYLTIKEQSVECPETYKNTDFSFLSVYEALHFHYACSSEFKKRKLAEAKQQILNSQLASH